MNDASQKNTQNELVEDVPEELYAPLGDVSFQKPKKEVIPEYVSYKDVDLAYSKKPFNTKKFFRIVLVLLILSLFVIAGIFYVKNKKNVYRNWLNGETKSITTKINAFMENKLIHLSNSTPFQTSALVNFDAGYDTTLVSKEEKELLDTLNHIRMSYALGMDIKNKELTHTLKSTYHNENLLTIYGNGNQNVFSLLVRGVTGKYLEIPNHISFLLDGNDKTRKKDLETFRKYIVRFLLNEIEEEDLEETEKTLTINGKDELVRDIFLHLSQKRIQSVLVKIGDALEKNKIFKEKIAHYFNVSEHELASYLQKIKDVMVQDIKIHVYAKKIVNKVVGYEVTVQKEATYTFEKVGEEKYKLTKNGQVLLDLEKNGDNYKVKINNYLIEINKKDVSTYVYSIQKEEELYTGTIHIKDTELKLSKQGNIDLTINHLAQNQEEISHLKCSFTYNTKTVNALSKYDDTQKMAYQDLKEEEREEIKRRVRETSTVKQVLDDLKKYIK